MIVDLDAGDEYVIAMIDWPDAFIRLTAATLIGAGIGLHREMHGKPTGVRTMGVVALGSALIVLVGQHLDASDASAGSRVIQGVITGIGFLGAGVILRNPGGKRVRGLTTAATIWLTACIGVACGFAAWPLVGTSVGLATLIFAFGKPLERAVGVRVRHNHHNHHHAHGPAGHEDQGSEPAGTSPPNARPTA